MNRQIIKADKILNQNYKSRPQNIYLVSKILDSTTHQHNLPKMRNTLFKQLSISKFAWRHPLLAANLTANKLRNKLIEYEKFLNIPASQTSIQEFRSFKNSHHFSNLEQINQQISQAINKKFLIQDFFEKAKEDEFTKLSIEFRNFYNFIINSSVLTKNNLLQLLYLPFVFTTLDSIEGITCGSVADDGFKSSAVIFISLYKGWFDQSEVESQYQSGHIANNHFFDVFTHEFAHAFSTFYSIPSKYWPVLNRNIKDMRKVRHVQWELGSNDESPITLLEYHFLKTFGEKIPEIKIEFEILKKARDFMLNKFGFKSKHYENQDYINLVKWVSVPSNYGRTGIFNQEINKQLDKGVKNPKFNNQNDYDHEWFAEGFAFYYLAPETEHNQVWEFWHQLFTQEIPNLK